MKSFRVEKISVGISLDNIDNDYYSHCVATFCLLPEYLVATDSPSI